MAGIRSMTGKMFFFFPYFKKQTSTITLCHLQIIILTLKGQMWQRVRGGLQYDWLCRNQVCQLIRERTKKEWLRKG